MLTFTDTTGDVTGAAFRVRGIFKTSSSTFDDANVYVRKTDIQQLGQVHYDHEIAILLHDEDQVSDFRDQLSDAISNNYSSNNNSVQDWLQLQPLLSTMMSSMNAGNQVILVIFVVAMGFGIINILLMSVFERTREFGVLMAEGMKKSSRLTKKSRIRTSATQKTGAALWWTAATSCSCTSFSAKTTLYYGR